MLQKSEKTDHIGYAKRLHDLCNRLREAGYEVDSRRLNAYKDTFATNELLIRETRISDLEERIPFPKFLNGFHESNEILEACGQFPDLSPPDLRDRLKRVLNGPEILADETAVSGGPRNYLFELVMASTLKAAGFEVRLDGDEDVYFEISGVPCFMECKRVLSKRKLGERIGFAANQVQKRCDNAQDSGARGIVAIDVSRLINPGTHLFDCATLGDLSSAAERKLESFRVENQSTLQAVHERCVLGVYVYSRLPGAVREPVGLWTARKTIFIILHAPGSESGMLAFEFFRRIAASQ
jgi:hypothetical protein